MNPSRLVSTTCAWLFAISFGLSAGVAFAGAPSVRESMAAAAKAAAAKADAAKLKQQGDEAMAVLKFAEALRCYDEAYALEPTPALLYNRGRALQLLDRLPEALDAFEAFRREAPQALRARVAKLDEVLAELRGKIAELTITTVPEAVDVQVSGRSVGVTPLAQALRVNGGKGILIELRKEGYHTVERRLDLAGGKPRTLEVTLQPRDTTALLIVRSPVAGARVAVDGKAVSDVPAETYLAPGAHRVVVERAGYEPAEVSVVLEAGQRKAIDVGLSTTVPLYQRWWLWTAVGAAVAGGVVLTVALTQEAAPGTGDIPPGQVTASLFTF